MQIESIIDLQYPLYAHCPQNEEQKNKESPVGSFAVLFKIL